MTDKLKLNLGIDFGTRYTKVCLYGDDIPERAEVIVNPESSEPNKGMFSDGVHDTKKEVKSIKMTLAELSEKAINGEKGKSKHVRRIEDFCAYFLSQVIRQSKAIFLNSKEGQDRIKGKEVSWTANIGVPVKYCDSPVIAYFHRVLHLALDLSQIDENKLSTQEIEKRNKQYRLKYQKKLGLEKPLEEMSKDDIVNFVNQRLRNQPDQINGEAETDNLALPELEASLRPYINTPGVGAEGIYFVFDIGSGTLDGTACNLQRSSSKNPLIPNFYSTALKEIGLDTLVDAQAISNPDQVFSDKILEQIEITSVKLPKAEKQGDYIANKFWVRGESDKESDKKVKNQQIIQNQQKIHQLVGEVIIKAKKKYKEICNLPTLDVILLGGGAKSPYYVDTIFSTHKTFKQERASIPEYRKELFDNPADNRKERGLIMNGLSPNYFNRYLIAYGLALPGESTATFPSGFSEQPEKFAYNWFEDNLFDLTEDENVGIGRVHN